MSSALSTYSFLSAKLKTKLSKSLSRDFIDRLVRVESLAEAAQLLHGTEYEYVEVLYSTTGDIKEIESAMWNHELELYTKLYKYIKKPVKTFIEALSIYYEVENIKSAARLWFDAYVRGRNIDGKVQYINTNKIVHNFDINRLVRASDTESFIQALADSPYAQIAKLLINTVVHERSLFKFELALDDFYYKEIFKAAEALDSSDKRVATRILGIDVDIQNISRVTRLKKFSAIKAGEIESYFIHKGKKLTNDALLSIWQQENSVMSGVDMLQKVYSIYLTPVTSSGSGAQAEALAKLAFLEAALYMVMDKEAAKCLAGNPFSIGIVLAYFIRRREEIRLIMTILNAKNYSLPEERIRNFL